MKVNVKSSVSSMLHSIYLHVIKVLMYEIDQETGEPKIDPDTRQPIPTGRSLGQCTRTAQGRVGKIYRAMHNLSNTHTSNNTHTTPSGRVIYYTPIRKPEWAYILYTCENNDIDVFAVYTEGKDIQQVLTDLISRRRQTGISFQRHYEHLRKHPILYTVECLRYARHCISTRGYVPFRLERYLKQRGYKILGNSIVKIGVTYESGGLL